MKQGVVFVLCCFVQCCGVFVFFKKLCISVWLFFIVVVFVCVSTFVYKFWGCLPMLLGIAV